MICSLISRIMLNDLDTNIRACTLCSNRFDHKPRPIFAFSKLSRIALIGQAPGRKVHESGIPWNDASGKRLRTWLGVSDEAFYDNKNFAIITMAFCYPGKGKSGDLPPPKICFDTWHDKVTQQLKNIKLIVLIGAYAREAYLPKHKGKLDELSKNLNLPSPYFVIPHPSPRNGIWLKKHPWFERSVVPELQKRVNLALMEVDT